MIQAITFDLDGVYFSKGKAEFVTAVEHLGVPRAEVERVFLESPEMNERYKKGKLSDKDFWLWAASEWKLDKTPSELVDLLISGYEINEEVASLVKKVRENGYKTLICSNNFPARVEGLQTKYNFLNDFDVAVFSYEAGAAKPDKAIFQWLVDKAGVEASNIVFSDDDAAKLAGAQALDFQTFPYTTFDDFVQRLHQLGVRIEK